MSWLEGETDVLEKLHGALTEVGLPAFGTEQMHKKKVRTENTIMGHLSEELPKKVCGVRTIRLSMPAYNLCRKRASRTDAQDNKKEKHNTGS